MIDKRFCTDYVAAYTCRIMSTVGFVLAMRSNGDLLTCFDSIFMFHFIDLYTFLE